MNNKELEEELRRLFQTAKKFDEFEFVNVLIGYNGMGDQRALSHLYESRKLIRDVISLMAKSTDKHLQTRLALLIYSHIFEMDELYNILGNLLRIAAGQELRYIPNLLNKDNQDELSPTEKLKQLEQLAEQSRFETLITAIEGLYSNKIRNAFFHSAYSLIEDNFLIIRGDGVKIGDAIHKTVSIENYLLPLINSTVNFIEYFFALIDESKHEYKESKWIQGRFSELQPIEIIGDPDKGLIGFRTINGSWIKISNSYDSEIFVQAMNIRISIDNAEIAQLKDKITAYDDKTPTGKEFDKLKKEVLATNNKGLIRDLAITYYNWANNTVKIADVKSGKEREILLKYAIQRYDLAIQTDASFGHSYNNRATTKLNLSQLDGSIDNGFRWSVIEDIKEALKHQPLMFEAYSNWGRLLYEIGFSEKEYELKVSLLTESIEKYNKAIEIFPKDNEVYQGRGNVYWELARTIKVEAEDYIKLAISDYEVATHYKPELINYLSISTLLSEYAEISKNESQVLLKRSIETLKDAQQIFGANADTSYRLANKYMALFTFTEEIELLNLARAAYEDVLKLDNSNVKAANNLGHCIFNIAIREVSAESAIKLLEQALTNIEKAVEKGQGDYNSYYNLGLIFSEIGRRLSSPEKEQFLAKAIDNLDRCNSIEDGSVSYDLARIFTLKGEFDNGVIQLDKYLQNNKAEKQGILEEKDFKDLIKEPGFSVLISKYFD